MNIFEGARRISKIIYVLVAFIGLMLLKESSPYLSRYYSYQANGQLKQVEDCGQQTWFNAEVEGKPSWASISVCGWSEGPKFVGLNSWELEKLDDAIYRARFESYGEIIFGTLASLVGFYLLFRGIGWVLRGFLGVPTGQDYRISPAAKQK